MLEKNPVERYLSTLPSRNERNAREALNLMARYIKWPVNGNSQAYDGLKAPWWRLTETEVKRVHDALVEGSWITDATGKRPTPAVVNRHLTALRGVLRECWKLELMPASAYLDAAAKLRSVPAAAHLR